MEDSAKIEEEKEIKNKDISIFLLKNPLFRAAKGSANKATGNFKMETLKVKPHLESSRKKD
ncbi:hypothetical protein [Ferrimonas sediminum]|uniref:hypothetical protein n=1 Tax=Ferrimonas sediminum TaxID=718193 RepID=UPI000B813E3E|nr:hypothetical protein [Ferrimonas sediminum]